MNEKYSELIKHARNAIDKGFYASQVPSRRYGAAVLTENGNIYSAGQYSSFNHITSIHAEMSAILVATMSKDYNIIALALAGNENANICSCGICLQFIKEHSLRTGIDMDIIYDIKGSCKIFKQSNLTSKMW